MSPKLYSNQLAITACSLNQKAKSVKPQNNYTVIVFCDFFVFWEILPFNRACYKYKYSTANSNLLMSTLPMLSLESCCLCPVWCINKQKRLLEIVCFQVHHCIVISKLDIWIMWKTCGILLPFRINNHYDLTNDCAAQPNRIPVQAFIMSSTSKYKSI